MRLHRPSDPDVGRHLLREEGEVIVDVVHHHWAAYGVPLLESALAVLMLGLTSVVPVQISTVPFVIALGLFAHAAWGTARERRDRFVITNMRVFRMHGVLSQTLATMPLHRILDITVDQAAARPPARLRPLLLRVRRPGAGAARHPLRRPTRRARPRHPARRPAHGPARAAGQLMGLPFDPIDEAARQWGLRWPGVPAMHAVTSLMRVQQLVIGRLDTLLQAARPDVRPLRGAGAAGLLLAGVPAARQDGGAAAGAPHVGHLDRAAARGRRARRHATPPPRGRPGRARRDHAAPVARWSRPPPPTSSTPISRWGPSPRRSSTTLSALLTPVRRAAGDF